MARTITVFHVPTEGVEKSTFTGPETMTATLDQGALIVSPIETADKTGLARFAAGNWSRYVQEDDKPAA